MICDDRSRRRLNASPTKKRARRTRETARYIPAATVLHGIEAGNDLEVSAVRAGALVFGVSLGKGDGEA
jgi:hypothetical protein